MSLGPISSLLSTSGNSPVPSSWSLEILEKGSHVGAVIFIALAVINGLQKQRAEAYFTGATGLFLASNAFVLRRCKVLGDVQQLIAKQTQLTADLTAKDQEIQTLNTKMGEIIRNISDLGKEDQAAVETLLPRIDSAKRTASDANTAMTRLQAILAKQSTEMQTNAVTIQGLRQQMADVEKLKADEEAQSKLMREQLDRLHQDHEASKQLLVKFQKENQQLHNSLEELQHLPQQEKTALDAHREAIMQLNASVDNLLKRSIKL